MDLITLFRKYLSDLQQNQKYHDWFISHITMTFTMVGVMTAFNLNSTVYLPPAGLASILSYVFIQLCIKKSIMRNPYNSYNEQVQEQGTMHGLLTGLLAGVWQERAQNHPHMGLDRYSSAAFAMGINLIMPMIALAIIGRPKLPIVKAKIDEEEVREDDSDIQNKKLQ